MVSAASIFMHAVVSGSKKRAVNFENAAQVIHVHSLRET